ncbi:MAG: PAS domain S-box protein, partial [Rhodocyclaceae bacterium]
MNISEHFNSLLDAIPETIVVVSESGVILWVNQSWRDFAIGNGAARSTVTGVGLDYFGVCRAAGLETLCEGIRSVALGVRKELEFEYACHSPSAQRWFTLKVRQLGSLAGVAVLTHSNCTDRKLAEGEQAARCEEMKRVLDTVEAIIVSLDRDAVVTSINAYGERLLGRPAAEIVGSNWFERCIPPLSQRERVRSVFQTLIDDQWSRQEPFVNDVLTAAGERRTISWRNAVLKDAEGLVVGILSAGLDLTEEVQLSRQLALSHDAMMRAEAIGHFGSWWWDREEGAWRASEQARCLFGLDAAVCFNPASILRRIHRDDRRMVLGNWRAMLSGGAREYEYRLVAADGGVWLRDRVWIRAEADTGVTHCYGTSQDITSSKLTALALGESERLLVEAQETARIGTYVYDMVLDRWTSSRVLDQIMGIG